MTDKRGMIVSDGCDAVEALLSAFADGELSGVDRATVERHVGSCGRCRAVVDDYRGWGVALRDMIGAATPRDLSTISWPPEPVRAPAPQTLTLRRRVPYDVAGRRNPWPVFAGALALVVLIIGIGLWRPVDAERSVEIERLDAEGPVMVFTSDEGRTAIIWLSEPDVSTNPDPTPI